MKRIIDCITELPLLTGEKVEKVGKAFSAFIFRKALGFK